jgi:hypothetical protein
MVYKKKKQLALSAFLSRNGMEGKRKSDNTHNCLREKDIRKSRQLEFLFFPTTG